MKILLLLLSVTAGMMYAQDNTAQILFALQTNMEAYQSMLSKNSNSAALENNILNMNVPTNITMIGGKYNLLLQLDIYEDYYKKLTNNGDRLFVVQTDLTKVSNALFMLTNTDNNYKIPHIKNTFFSLTFI